MKSEDIGNLIKKLRELKNLTQKDLADMLIISRETVSKWERGIYIPPSEFLIKLAEIFDISIEELMRGEIKSNHRYIRKIIFFVILIMSILLIIIYQINFNNDEYHYIFKGNSKDFNAIVELNCPDKKGKCILKFNVDTNLDTSNLSMNLYIGEDYDYLWKGDSPYKLQTEIYLTPIWKGGFAKEVRKEIELKEDDLLNIKNYKIYIIFISDNNEAFTVPLKIDIKE